MDGAAQQFSGDYQTTNFDYDDLEELFYSLEWHLCAKSIINSFYKSCGQPIPYPPTHKEATKTFRVLHCEWERQSERYRPNAITKYLQRHNETSALYLYIFHYKWFITTNITFIQQGQVVPKPKESFWCSVFADNLKLYNKILDIGEFPCTTHC